MRLFILSSPHTRGTQPRLGHGRGHQSFIPAYAGHTSPGRPSCSSRAFHPRIRGAHNVSTQFLHASILSSPHTRGTLHALQVGVSSAPFIPAYAGHTMIHTYGAPPATFHPRIRGAHKNKLDRIVPASLSSPHTRGTRDGRPGAVSFWPFIPAYAGHTRAVPRPSSHAPFHPRIRGAHWIDHLHGLGQPLSSPHTRGTPRHSLTSSAPPPFIPAYAGHTKTVAYGQSRSLFHPRIRGAHGGTT